MKKMLMILAMIGTIATSQGYSQIQQLMSGDTVLWQDFTNYNGSPNSISWKGNYDVSPFDSSYAIRITKTDDGAWLNRPFGNPNSGIGSAAYNFNLTVRKDLLVTPLINLTGGTPQISFDITCTSSLNTNPYRMNRPDTLFVVVSEDGATDTTARFMRSGIIAVIDTSTNFASGPIHYDIDLSSFSTRSAVHIGLLACEKTPNGLSGYFVYIDNVYIRKTNPGDYAVLNFETFRSYYFYNQNYTTSAVIKNWGTSDQSNVPVILFVDDTPVDTAIVSLDGGAQITASFNWTAQVEGAHTLKVKTMLDGDAVPANDSIVRPMVVFKNHWQQLFYDDFSAGADKWSIANLSTYNGAIWMLFDVNYPYYQLNEYCFTNVLSANDSADGTGWTHTSSTLNTPVNAAGMDTLVLEYDYDFSTWIPPFFFDYWYIAGSTDGGTTWDTLMTDTVSQRAAHNTLDISDYAGQSSILLKFIYNESGGYNKWWAIDNVIIRGRTAAVGIKDSPVYPNTVVLYPNYPNPFNPSTTLSYFLPSSENVQITVYNTLGQQIRTLVNGPQARGNQSVQWNGKDDRDIAVSSGVYIFRVQAGNYTKSGKMMLIK